ncbi:MAG: hypothetical protein ACRDTF_13605 [Pseudonocardiaceae bacterium]
MLAAIWHEVHVYRAAIHRARSPVRCDLRVSASDRRQGGTGTIQLDGDCACRDFLVDMIAEGRRLLAERGNELRNPLGAVRMHVRKRAAGDWIRRRRTEMGAQARVDRIRTGDRARGLPDEFHRALLEYLVDEAGSMAPLDSQDALVRRLAVRCAAEFGGEPERYLARVVDGVAVVERHCRYGPRVNAGTAVEPKLVTWWERFIERPLGRRPRRNDKVIPVVPGEYGRETDLLRPPAVYDLERVVNGSMEIRTTAVAVLVVALRRHPDDPAVALRAGISDLVAQGLLAERAATKLLTDRTRFATATQELSAFG